MDSKTYIPDGAAPRQCQIGASLSTLAETIAARAKAQDPESYTYRLLSGKLDTPLKKLMEEAGEVALAAKDASAEGATSADVDHLRYEAGDVVYHLMVVLQRFDISLDELAAEMNTRMTEDEIATIPGAVRLKPEHVNRGR